MTEIPEPGQSVVVETKELGLGHIVPAIHDPVRDPKTKEIVQPHPPSTTEIHRPQTWNDYEPQKRCLHDGGFKFDQINLNSKLVDEACNLCGFGRVRGATDDELREAEESRAGSVG